MVILCAVVTPSCDDLNPVVGTEQAGVRPIGANLRFFFKAVSNHAASSSLRNSRGMRPSSQAWTSVA